MQRILIIAYYFPPCNRTPAERISSWAENLHKDGYYPVIVTRKWEKDITRLEDTSIPTSPGVKHIRSDHYEVYYLPFKGTLKDQLFYKYGNSRYVTMRKLATLWELFFQNLAWRVSHLKPFKSFCAKYLREQQDIRKAVISGNPFLLFRLGYELHKQFGLTWIADYRDAWTTATIHGRLTGVKGWLNKINRHFEKKWVGSAAQLTSVSEPLAQSLSEFTGVPGAVVENGFNTDDFNGVADLPTYEKFTITYVGTLYPGQQIEIFLAGYRQFIDEVKPEANLFLPGLAHFDDQSIRIENALVGYESHFETTDRIPRKEVLKAEVKSHYLLYVAWQGHAGIVPSKIYEYIASGTPIIVAPKDGSVVDAIIKDSKAGVLLNSSDQVASYLRKAYEQYREGNYRKNDLAASRLKKYSREYQAGRLAKALNEIA